MKLQRPGRRTCLTCFVLLCLLVSGGCSIKITRVKQAPGLKGSAEIATFNNPSYPSRSVEELLPEGITPRDTFYTEHSESATFQFILSYQGRWHDYHWESVLMDLAWQQAIDPASGRVYIEALRGPFFAMAFSRKTGRLFGRRQSGPGLFASIRMTDGFETGWREIDGTAYQTITYHGYMAVSTQSLVGTVDNADGSDSIGFRDRDGWAMIPVEIELCADLTATARFKEHQRRGRLSVVTVQNPVEVSYRSDSRPDIELIDPDTER